MYAAVKRCGRRPATIASAGRVRPAAAAASETPVPAADVRLFHDDLT